jgi:hypothetical protein
MLHETFIVAPYSNVDSYEEEMSNISGHYMPEVV